MTSSTAEKPRRGRPPKNQNATAETKAALIRSGIEEMTKNGYLSSNIEGILKAVGVPKGSFYYYFKSKEDFGKAIIEDYARFFSYKLDKYLLDTATPSALKKLQLFCQSAKSGVIKHEFNRGCLIGGLLQEESLLPAGYDVLLNNILNDWQNKVEACLKEAQKLGEIDDQLDCHELSIFFWLGWEGSIARVKLIKNIEPLDIFIKQFFQHSLAQKK